MNRQAIRTTRRSALFVALLGSAFASQAAAEYATVVSSTPVNVPMTVAQRVCSNERQVVPAQQTGAGAVLGMIAGGVIGNTIGGGSGRALATGVGAIAGAVAGNQIEANTAVAAGTEVPVQRCQVVNTSQQRTVGYDVMYEYQGQRYSTRVDHDPGARLEVMRGSDGVPTPVAAAAPQPQPQPRYGQPVPAYGQAAPVYAPAPAYYTPAPVYAPAPVVYVNPYPVVNIGFGYYGGYHRRWR